MYTPHPVSPSSNPLYHLGYLSQLRNQHGHIAINQSLVLFGGHRPVTSTLLSCARLLSWDRHHVMFSCFPGYSGLGQVLWLSLFSTPLTVLRSIAMYFVGSASAWASLALSHDWGGGFRDQKPPVPLLLGCVPST